MIIKINKKMKNPLCFDEQFITVNKNTGDFNLIGVTYSKSGVCRAWHGYADRCVGYAGGYGYDKVSTVLANAIEVLYELPQWTIKSRGAGVGTLLGEAKKHGIYINTTRDEAITSVIKKFNVNK